MSKKIVVAYSGGLDTSVLLIWLKKRFDAEHKLRYGTSSPQERSEIVSLRVTVTGILKKPGLEKVESGKVRKGGIKFNSRPVHFGKNVFETDIWDRKKLVAGDNIKGPALIEEHASTTVIHPEDRLEVDPYGNLLIKIGAAETCQNPLQSPIQL